MKSILYLFLSMAMLLSGATSALAADAPAQPAAQAAGAGPHNQAQLWRDARSGQAGTTSARGPEAGVLIQSGGETWRELRNGPISLYGGIALCVVVVAIALFYFRRGMIRLSSPPTGRQIQRFSSIERMAHWSMAISFVILAVSGLVLLFGKHVLLPVIGHTVFSWLAVLAKNLHNFIGPLFLLSVVVSFFLFVKDNIWQAEDAHWIAKAGGLLSGEHVPSWRFNFGEKFMFWFGVVFLGLTVGISGLIMDFPNFGQLRGTMQTVNIIHGIGALLFMCLMLGHIYIGTIGMEGAYASMRYGHVDETWAKEHHELWYNQAKQQQSGGPSKAGQGTTAAAHT
jgi:formate dehydrogenase subunit gamma